MGLETVVNIADFVRTNPPGSDPKSQGDDHLRNIKTALLNNIVGYTGAVTVTGVDGGVVNAYTLTPAAGTLIAYGLRMVAIFSPTITNTGAVTLNISALGVKNVLSVSGAALVANDLVAGNVYAAFYNGTEFRLLSITKNYADQLAFGSSLPAQSLGFVISSGTVASFSTTFTGFAANEVKGSDIPSAATINLTTATGNLVHVTGTTTITAITIPSGAERTVVFDGVLTLTHNATTLILPGGINITTAAGDSMKVRGDGAGNARVVSYQRASGYAVTSPYALGSPTVLTPSVAATLDALSFVTASANGYLIEIEGIKPSTSTVGLTMRVANAGVVDTASNYLKTTTSISTLDAQIVVANTVASAGRGASGKIFLMNANSVGSLKNFQIHTGIDQGGGVHAADMSVGFYIGGAISGLSFYWAGALNFAATGNIRIYPILNT